MLYKQNVRDPVWICNISKLSKVTGGAMNSKSGGCAQGKWECNREQKMTLDFEVTQLKMSLHLKYRIPGNSGTATGVQKAVRPEIYVLLEIKNFQGIHKSGNTETKIAH